MKMLKMTKYYQVMKKAIILLSAVLCICSCSTGARLVNSASYSKNSAPSPVAAVFAEIDVSPVRITHFMLPSKTVLMGGYDNVVATAVREALDANGGGDVLVALETQVKYGSKGQIESITVSGYPGKYKNFRNPGDDYLKSMHVEEPGEKSSPIGGLFGKKK